jgi:hypothetical protein
MFSIAEHGIYLPVYQARQQPVPVVAGIELDAAGRKPLCGAIREDPSLQTIIRPDDLQAE